MAAAPLFGYNESHWVNVPRQQFAQALDELAWGMQKPLWARVAQCMSLAAIALASLTFVAAAAAGGLHWACGGTALLALAIPLTGTISLPWIFASVGGFAFLVCAVAITGYHSLNRNHIDITYRPENQPRSIDDAWRSKLSSITQTEVGDTHAAISQDAQNLNRSLGDLLGKHPAARAAIFRVLFDQHAIDFDGVAVTFKIGRSTFAPLGKEDPSHCVAIAKKLGLLSQEQQIDSYDALITALDAAYNEAQATQFGNYFRLIAAASQSTLDTPTDCWHALTDQPCKLENGGREKKTLTLTVKDPQRTDQVSVESTGIVILTGDDVETQIAQSAAQVKIHADGTLEQLSFRISRRAQATSEALRALAQQIRGT